MGKIILVIIVIAMIIGLIKKVITKKQKSKDISNEIEKISPKSRLVALLFCLFLNPISAQRFYAKGFGGGSRLVGTHQILFVWFIVYSST